MSEAAADLFTIRDFLRFAVSSFRQAKLAHGHGASTALDEAAFLILETLRLPVDDINPWLEARLTTSERQAIADLIRERITTRKPAAYLVNRTYIHGVPFYVDERVIVPRSYIGELLCRDGLRSVVADPDAVGRVLDLCTGSGCLAVLVASAFRSTRVDASDISRDALEVAKINVRKHRLKDRIRLIHSSLFDKLDGTYDLIVTNPPYVDARGMRRLPREYRHEPRLALAGGRDGLELVRKILRQAGAHLASRGLLVCEIGDGRKALERAYARTPFAWPLDQVFVLSREDLPED